MCGIAGLRLKNPDLHNVLGELVVPMLDVLASRGPDSTGVAIYRRDAPAGQLKFSLCAPDEDYDWAGYVAALRPPTARRPSSYAAGAATRSSSRAWSRSGRGGCLRTS